MKLLNYLIIIYFVFINILGFIIMGLDKRKAKNNKWRIKEKTLFSIAAVGGSVGSILGMQHFRHKTKHKTFVFGMPLILILQIIAYIAIHYGA